MWSGTVYGVSEIGGQTLGAYSTCKNEKSHINMGPEILPLQVMNIHFLFYKYCWK